MSPESDESLHEITRRSLEEFKTGTLNEDTVRSIQPPSPQELEKPRRGLRRRVFIILLLLMAIPSYVILALSYLTASRVLIGEIRLDAKESTQRLALELDRVLGDYGRELQAAIREEENLTPMVVSDPEFQEIKDLPNNLELTHVEFPFRTMMFLHSSDGTITSELHSTRNSWLELPVSRETLENHLSQFYKQQTDFPPLRSIEFQSNENQNQRFLIMSTPLLDEEGNAKDTLLSAMIPVDDLFDDSIQNLLPVDRNFFLMSEQYGILYSKEIYNHNRDIIREIRTNLRLPDPESRGYFDINQDSVSLAVTSQRIRTGMFSNSELRTRATTWDVVETVNLDDTLVALNKLYWSLMLIGIFTTLIAFVASVYLSDHLVKPIVNLTDGMRRFARGELDYRVEVKTKDELENLADAANIMASSLRASYENLANRMLELDEKANQLSLIYSISRSINQSLDLDLLFERIVRELRSIISCDRISMSLHDKEKSALTMDYVFPTSRSILPKYMEIPMEGSVMGRAMKEGNITLKTLKEDGKYFEEIHLANVGIKRICIVPLMATSGVIGTLNLGSRDEEAFQMSEIKLLERVAETLGLAVEHGRLYQKVAKFAEELEDTVDARTKELKKAQERLVQSEKFAATGSIAAHIGHELNNPLSIIKNYLKIADGRLLNEHPSVQDIRETRDGLKVIEEEIDRIARIVIQLRQVSKPAQTNPIRFILKDELDKLIELFQATMRKRGIIFYTHYDEELHEVVVAVDSMRQIIINLIRNSIDALEEIGHGEIILKTRLHDKDKSQFEVIVEDSGPGIPNENMNSIFDPFFTTKKAGKGTGLGLSVSYSLAQSMGGTMTVKSKPGSGTRIALVLPIEPKDDTKPPDEKPKDTPPKNETNTSGIFKRRNRKIMIG